MRLLLRDELPASEKAETDLHLGLCRSCCRRLAAEFRAAEGTEPELLRAPDHLKARVMRGRERPAPRLWQLLSDFRTQAAAAGGLVLILIAVLALFPVFQPDTPEKPDRIDNPLRENLSLSNAPRLLSPETNAPVDVSSPLEFRWSKIDGAIRYQIFILDKKGAVLLQKEVENERFSPAGSEFRRAAGETYFWYVSAQMPDGAQADSEIGKFSVP